MSEPAPSTRRCPYCDATNPLEAVSCASCKHSLPLGESEEATGYLPATRPPDSREAPPEDSESPTGYLTAPGSTEVDGEAPTDYSPHPGRRAASGARREDGPLEVGQKFGRYHIIKLLGLGGMGAVYRAWDEELGVGVAVKIVRPEIATDPELARDLEKRFKRELLLARQVTHPNVVRIHDMGEIGGIKFITMPYVDGAELSSILKKHEGGLPVEQVLTVARGVVAGLVAAHRAGVVHRDLKPANIMVENGTNQAMIMDFGIARSSSSADPGATPGVKLSQEALASGLTMAGAIVGTLEYMAPEQFRGEAVDHRADIYAFGLILYDLLSGPPTEGRSPHGLRGGRPAREEGPAPAGGGAAGRPRAPRADRHPVHPAGPRRALRHDRGAGGRPRPPRRARRAAAAAEAVLEGPSWRSRRRRSWRRSWAPGSWRGRGCRPRRRRRCRCWWRTSTTGRGTRCSTARSSRP